LARTGVALGNDGWHAITSPTPALLPAVPGNVVLFQDPHPKSPVKDGFNQVGVVLPDLRVLFVRSGRAVEFPLEELARLPAAVLALKPPGVTEQAARFFNHHRRNSRIVALGLQALEAGNYGVFHSLDIVPVFRGVPSQQEYESAWEALMRKLEVGDLVFVFEQRSLIDRLIARLDHGPWSHVATYTGDGRIVEAVPGKGVVERGLDVYKDRYIRLGVYRAPSSSPEMRLEVVAGIRALLGRGYGYRKVLRLGLAKLVARVLKGDSAHWVEAGVTPNDLIYSGRLVLIGHV
jgi:hypothetical protein